MPVRWRRVRHLCGRLDGGRLLLDLCHAFPGDQDGLHPGVHHVQVVDHVGEWRSFTGQGIFNYSIQFS